MEKFSSKISILLIMTSSRTPSSIQRMNAMEFGLEDFKQVLLDIVKVLIAGISKSKSSVKIDDGWMCVVYGQLDIKLSSGIWLQLIRLRNLLYFHLVSTIVQTC